MTPEQVDEVTECLSRLEGQVFELKTEHERLIRIIRAEHGKRLHAPDGTDLAPGFRRDNFSHIGDQQCRCIKCVLALIHGRRARMVGETIHGNVPSSDADNALYDADRGLFALQKRALLDVQFNVTRNVAGLPDVLG